MRIFVTGATGVIGLRLLPYGPGTYYEHEPPPPPRVHVDQAARRTIEALDAPSGAIAIVEE
jgi:hypothetical protein